MVPLARAIQTSMPKGMLNVLFGKNELIALTQESIVKATCFQDIKNKLSDDISNNFRNASHFFSFQNGIAHTDEDFIEISQALNAHAKTPSCIAYFYNTSDGTLGDIKRIAQQKLNKPTENLSVFKANFPKFIKLIVSSHKSPSIVHLAHSEAGLILSGALPEFSEEVKSLTKQHLEVVTFGSPKPVGSPDLKSCINIYSRADFLTLPAIYLYENEHAEIRIVPSTSQKEQKHFYFIDHSALGNTYFEQIKLRLSSPSFLV